MKKETRSLEPIGRTLLFSAAVHALPTGIMWLSEPTDEELHADDFLIQRCGESVGWWTGDIVVKLHQRQGHDQSLDQFAGEYARARSLNEQRVQEYAHVANFYPVLDRLKKPASYSHHRLVWESSATPSLASCLSWLARASKGDVDGIPWSTGRLREELSKARRATMDAAEPPAPTGDYESLIRLELWSAQSLPRLATIDAPTARDMLTHLASTAALIDALRTRAATSPAKSA